MIFHKLKKFLIFKKFKIHTFIKIINKNYIFLEQKNFLYFFNFIINIKNNFYIKFKKNNILTKNIFFYLKKKVFKNKKKYRFLFSFFDYINFNFFQKKKTFYNYFFIPNFFIFFKKKNKSILIFQIIKKKNDIIFFSKKLNKIILKINNNYILNIIYKKNILNNFFTKKKIFLKNICKIKKNIKNGNLIQCVISNKIFIKKYFKNLNIIISKYNSYINLKEITIEIYSPEYLIKLENNIFLTKPIAGTIDKNHHNFLILKNKKEISEHLMLLDLSINDLFKNNIKKIFFKRLIFCEYHKNLIHIVSELSCTLYIKNVFLLIKNMFPAGTLSGSPKKNSIKLIKKFEKKNRNIFGGIFYFLNKNNLESNILIRLIFTYKNNKILQSGAGIINNSVNYLEWLETILKKQNLIK